MPTTLSTNCSARLRRTTIHGYSEPNPDRQPTVAFPLKAKRWTINFFIGFHLLSIACWCLPINTPLLAPCRSFVRPYFLWAGLFQSWDMFAPVPKEANTYIEATLIYKDGSRTTWTYPRMDEITQVQRLFKERYRKFTDYFERDEFDDVLQDVARHIARLKSRPGNPVKTVILIEKLSFIVPSPDGSYGPSAWDKHVLLGYGVRPEDLR